MFGPGVRTIPSATSENAIWLAMVGTLAILSEGIVQADMTVCQYEYSDPSEHIKLLKSRLRGDAAYFGSVVFRIFRNWKYLIDVFDFRVANDR